MKKLLALSLVLLTAASLHAQEKRVNLYSGYVFDDSFDNYYSSNSYYEGKIMGGYQWGAGVEFIVREDFGAELLYYHQDTKAPVSYYNAGPLSKTLDVGVNYALLGLNRYIKKGKAEPFGGLLIGAAWFNNKSPNASLGETSSITKFSVGGRLGVNVWASDRVAVKLQVQLLTAVQGFGGGFYFGTGGAGAGVSTYTTVTQFGLGGGLTFKLGS